MKTRTVRIGGSQGELLPKSLLRVAGLGLGSARLEGATSGS
jgi:hypothetical protein